MPSYQYDFLYKRLLPGMIYVVGGIILAIILFFTTESEIIPIIPIILWGISVIPLLVLFVIHSKKMSLRLLQDKSIEFEKKYKTIDYKKATEKLEAKMVIFEYIEGFYNRKRIHSSIDYQTPYQVYYSK
jgi:transposase InsO family protein